MRSLTLAALFVLASHANAFDFGSVVQTLTTAVQSTSPVLDQSLTSNPLIKNLIKNRGNHFEKKITHIVSHVHRRFTG